MMDWTSHDEGEEAILAAPSSRCRIRNGGVWGAACGAWGVRSEDVKGGARPSLFKGQVDNGTWYLAHGQARIARTRGALHGVQTP